MSTVKRTYSLPAELVQRFEEQVASRKRSATLARVLQNWLEAEERQRLRAEIEEGLRDMAEEYLAIAREFEPLDAELDRTLGDYDEQPDQ
jgi:metal-responsive CopG/Arc/MetJ family transcriptional regulator